VSHAFSIANEAGLTFEEQKAQWKRKYFIILQKGSIELAEKKELAHGREEGIRKGVEQEKREVASRLIAKGMTVEMAAKIAGVNVEVLSVTFK
jgi:predicted transposase/invertase (TIGR01784 family)